MHTPDSARIASGLAALWLAVGTAASALPGFPAMERGARFKEAYGDEFLQGGVGTVVTVRH